ncbi:MAG: hypothetical protein KF724_03855 [Phycisphaeraceae bacterium]|nr:hypothetical protein [Phycisphaeraceae bacterium]
MSSLPDDPIQDVDRDEDAPRREASVRLQVSAEAGGEAALREAMDPANQSLGEALRLSYRILQLAILGLLVTFLFSGFQTVQEGFTGVKTMFGRIQGQGAEAQLSPGLEPFWPYPIGEIVVFESRRDISLRNEFWPRLPPNSTIQRAIEAADTSNPIRPGADGSVLTADGDLAHLQVVAEYMVDDVSAYVERVDRALVDRLVRTALMRGVVLASAVTPLDDLLADRDSLRGRADAGTQQSGAARTETAAAEAAPDASNDAGEDSVRVVTRTGRRSELELLIREKAQEVLDQLGCGIRIVTLSVPERIAPLAVENRYAQVQVAREQAKEVVDKARQEAQSLLVAVAGPAYEALLEGVRRYETALLAGDEERADALLAELGTLMERADLGGEASLILNRARAYQGAIQATLGAETRRLEGLKESFRENPRQLVRQMWLDAIKQVFSDNADQIEVFSVAPGMSRFTVSVASSPDVMQSRRDAELRRKRAEADAAARLDPTWNLGLRGIVIDGPGRRLERDATRGRGR